MELDRRDPGRGDRAATVTAVASSSSRTLDELDVPVVVVSAEEDEATEWRDARHPVFVSPETLRLLDVRWPPFYVLIDPHAGRVLIEGMLFGAEQMASEIATYLPPLCP